MRRVERTAREIRYNFVWAFLFRREEVLQMIADYEVLVPTFGFYTDKEIMDRGKIEMIANYGVGFNNIDVNMPRKRNCGTNIPNTTCEPTAELAFALLLGVGRRIGYTTKLRNTEGLS